MELTTERDRLGKTSLMYATESGSFENVKRLVENKAKVNIRDLKSKNALMYGITNFDIVKCLVNAGTNVNNKDINGLTVLMSVAINGNKEIFEFLINTNVKIDARDKNGMTALMYAALFNHLEIVTILLKHGADINAKNYDGRYVLMFSNCNDIIKYLIENGAKTNIKDRSDTTILMYSVMYSSINTISLFLNDINARNNRGETALIIASQHLSLIHKIKFLLENGADPNIQDNSGSTALIYAAKFCDVETIKLLVNDITIRSKDNNNNTPLFNAAEYNNHDVVKYLIDKGIDTNALDNLKRSALLFAIEGNKEDNVSLLLNYTNPNEINKSLIVAVVRGYTNIVKLLLKAGASSTLALLRASGYDNQEILELLLKNGADVDYRNGYGETPLFKASLAKQYKNIVLLLKYGATQTGHKISNPITKELILKYKI